MSKSLKKNKSITIRVAEQEILLLKQKAALLGIGYQTLLGMLITHYIKGKIRLEV